MLQIFNSRAVGFFFGACLSSGPWRQLNPHRGSIIVAQESQGAEHPGRAGPGSHIFPLLPTPALVPKRTSSARTALFCDTEHIPQVLSADWKCCIQGFPVLMSCLRMGICKRKLWIGRGNIKKCFFSWGRGWWIPSEPLQENEAVGFCSFMGKVQAWKDDPLHCPSSLLAVGCFLAWIEHPQIVESLLCSMVFTFSAQNGSFVGAAAGEESADSVTHTCRALQCTEKCQY